MRNTRLTLLVGFMLISLQAVFAQSVVFTPKNLFLERQSYLHMIPQEHRWKV